MKIIRKISITAAEMSGGRKNLFFGCEEAGKYQNISEQRYCVALDKIPVSGKFSWPLQDLPTRMLFRIRGMWDMYKYMPETFIHSMKFMRTIGLFEILLNGQRIYHGQIYFWNYRKWRFWPAIEICFPPVLLKTGMNDFKIINHTRAFEKIPNAFKVPIQYTGNTVFQISDVQVLAVACQPEKSARLFKNTYLGHMFHNTVCLEQEDYSWARDLFTATCQGNLLVFLLNSPKMGYDLDLSLIDTDIIKKLNLFVALRYYGIDKNFAGSENAYRQNLKRFIKKLGNHFIGFGPHEQHGNMFKIIAQLATNDISRCAQVYIQEFKKIVALIRKIKANAAIWDTDPSFYSRYHLMAGADLPAIELGVHNVSLDIASARGTARAFGKKNWVAINSFECQAFGGLQMRDQDAQFDPDYEEKRNNLWWLTQHLLYLGGARIIYSESGILQHQAVTRQKEFEDPHLHALRAGQSALVDFSDKWNLAGQPFSEIAYLQGRHDIFRGYRFEPALNAVMGPSQYSWKMLEACFPDIILEEFPPGNGKKWRQEMISDLPFGETDILPIEAQLNVLANYRVLILTGWNTMDKNTYAKLKKYVQQGGILLLLLPQLTSTVITGEAGLHLKQEWVEGLCGITLAPGLPDDVPLYKIKPLPAASGFNNLNKIIRQQPREYFYKATYGGVYLKKIKYGNNRPEIILNADVSAVPLLLRNKLGRGCVYCFNFSDYPKNPWMYAMVNAVIKDILAKIPKTVYLKKGQNISYFTYCDKNKTATDYKVFLLMNDWYSKREKARGVISFLGKETNVIVHRNRVTVIALKGTRNAR